MAHRSGLLRRAGRVGWWCYLINTARTAAFVAVCHARSISACLNRAATSCQHPGAKTAAIRVISRIRQRNNNDIPMINIFFDASSVSRRSSDFYHQVSDVSIAVWQKALFSKLIIFTINIYKINNNVYGPSGLNRHANSREQMTGRINADSICLGKCNGTSLNSLRNTCFAWNINT